MGPFFSFFKDVYTISSHIVHIKSIYEAKRFIGEVNLAFFYMPFSVFLMIIKAAVTWLFYTAG